MWGFEMKKQILICILIISLISLGTVVAEDNKDYPLENTLSVKADYGIVTIDGIHAANVTQYNNSDIVQEEILSKDPDTIIKRITEDGAEEIDSISDYENVYEYLTEDGMYYSFTGKDDKFYLLEINVENWKADMLDKMDEFCLQNEK